MADVTLDCRDLSKSFGGLRAISDVDLQFEAGRVTALVGPNGAGKTTLFHLIAGSLRPDQGQVLYRGRRIDGRPAWEIARLGVGRLFQDTRVFPKLTVLQNVQTSFRYIPGESPFQVVFRPVLVRRVEREHEVRARTLLEKVGLAGDAERPAETLSFGQQKLLALASLLASDADVLLLDEPTAGVNPVLVERMLDLVRELAASGKTIVVVEHNLRVVYDAADWVYFIADGRVVSFGVPSDVLATHEARASLVGL